VQELQLAMLKCREELIAEKVARERDCELLGSELEQLRSQMTSNQTSWQQLNTEVSHLREQLGKL